MLPELVKPEPALSFADKPPEDPQQAVFMALGAASACWEDLRSAGVFESTRAKQIGDELMEYLYAHGLSRG